MRAERRRVERHPNPRRDDRLAFVLALALLALLATQALAMEVCG